MRGRATAVALPALVVLALVAVVAVAATGSTPAGSGSSRPPPQSLLDTLFTISLVAIVAGGVLLVYGLTQRKAIAHEIATGRYRRFSLISLLLALALFTALRYRGLRNWKPRASPDEVGDPAFPGQAPFPTTPDQYQPVPYQPSVAWLPIALVVGLVVAAVVAYVVADQRARRRGRPAAALSERLALVLDDTLDDLRAEADPRRAIIAAYARLERVLAANSVGRRPAETSEEYLQRVLTGLTLQSGAVERLTALFVQAKFSHYDVDGTMKEDAIDALELVRDELREGSEDSALPTPLSTSAGSTP
jgi:hypothetical protein